MVFGLKKNKVFPTLEGMLPWNCTLFIGCSMLLDANQNILIILFNNHKHPNHVKVHTLFALPTAPQSLCNKYYRTLE